MGGGSHDVGQNPAAAGHRAARIGVKLRLRVGMGGGRAQLNLRVERLLDRAAAGRVIERGGEREAVPCASGKTLCTRPLP